MKLGTEGLPAVEASLLHTILKLNPEFAERWSIVDAGPCGAVLFDESVAGAREAAGARAPVRVPVARRGALHGEALHLDRPVRAGDFLALLASIEAGLVPRRASLPDTQEPPTPPADPLAIAPVVRSGVIPPYPEELEGNLRGKLKKRPPVMLLASGRGRIQLTMLLLQQARSARELSEATRHSLRACVDYMTELDRLGLILWEATDVTAASPRQR